MSVGILQHHYLADVPQRNKTRGQNSPPMYVTLSAEALESFQISSQNSLLRVAYRKLP